MSRPATCCRFSGTVQQPDRGLVDAVVHGHLLELVYRRAVSPLQGTYEDLIQASKWFVDYSPDDVMDVLFTLYLYEAFDLTKRLITYASSSTDMFSPDVWTSRHWTQLFNEFTHSQTSELLKHVMQRLPNAALDIWHSDFEPLPEERSRLAICIKSYKAKQATTKAIVPTPLTVPATAAVATTTAAVVATVPKSTIEKSTSPEEDWINVLNSVGETKSPKAEPAALVETKAKEVCYGLGILPKDSEAVLRHIRKDVGWFLTESPCRIIELLGAIPNKNDAVALAEEMITEAGKQRIRGISVFTPEVWSSALWMKLLQIFESLSIFRFLMHVMDTLPDADIDETHAAMADQGRTRLTLRVKAHATARANKKVDVFYRAKAPLAKHNLVVDKSKDESTTSTVVPDQKDDKRGIPDAFAVDVPKVENKPAGPVLQAWINGYTTKCWKCQECKVNKARLKSPCGHVFRCLDCADAFTNDASGRSPEYHYRCNACSVILRSPTLVPTWIVFA